MTSLRQDTIKGLFWSFIERMGYQLIQGIMLIVLARILSPREFGLIGMLVVFTAIANTFIDSGLASALIQKKETSSIDFSTVFYFNFVISLLLYLILFFEAKDIATFYHEPALTLLAQVVGITLMINALGLVQQTIFIRNLDFHTIARISLISATGSGTIGIILALNGFGAMSLALQQVAHSIFKSSLYWIFSKWKPMLAFSRNSFKSLFSFGSKLLASSLLETIFQNIYTLIIGKVYNAKELGYYTQAYQVQQIPVGTLSAVVGQVTFPAFSTIQDDNKKLVTGFRKSLKILVFFNFPLMFGLMAIAKSMVIVIFTEKWLPAVPFIQLLSVSGILYTLHTLNLNIIKVKGRTDIYLKIEVLKKIIAAVAIVTGLFFGIYGLIIGLVVSSYIAYYINARFAGQLIGYSFTHQVRDLAPYFLISVIMGTLSWLSGIFLPFSDLYLLIIQTLLCIVVYLLLSKMLKLEALNETIQMGKKIFISIHKVINNTV